jgi:hypothetical protein
MGPDGFVGWMGAFVYALAAVLYIAASAHYAIQLF